MNFLEKISLAVLLCITQPALAYGIDILTGIPDNCVNNDQITDVKKLPFDVGPYWVSACKNVCEFDHAGNLTKRYDAWYPDYTCAGHNNNVVTRLKCIKNSLLADCNKIVTAEDDPRNHDCSKNNGLERICMGIRKHVTCSYPADNEDKNKYTGEIKVAECASAFSYPVK